MDDTNGGGTGGTRPDSLADLGTRLVGLATRPRNASRDLAAGLARELYGIVATPEPLHGERNENYRVRGGDGQDLILKLSGAGEEMAGIDLQIAALAHLARHAPDLPLPRVVPTVGGKASVDRAGFRVFAVSVLPGRSLEHWADYRPLLGPLGAMVGRVSRALAGFHHPWTPTRLAWDPHTVPLLAPAAGLIADAGLRKGVAGHFDRFASDVLPRFGAFRSQFIHNDGNTPNVLAIERTQAISGLVDFGDMIHGPIVVDLAVSCSDSVIDGADPLDTMRPLIAGYTSVRPLEEDEIDLLYDCVLARLGIGLAVDAWRRVHDAAGVDQLDAWRRTATTTVDTLLGAGRDRVIAAFRRAARRAITLPSLQPVVAAGPAPTIEAMIARRHRVLGRDLSLTYKDPLHIVRGDGVWLYDANGRAYLDAYNNVPQVGHAHPAVVEATARQSATLNTNTRYLHETVLEFSERLTATLPDELEVCAFVNSGSEANDIAWRMARVWTGHGGGLVMENAYHGITEAVAALSPYDVAGNGLAPHVRTLRAPDSYRRPGADESGDADRAIAALAGAGLKPALFMVDSGLTSNGIPDVRPDYLATVAAKVRAAGGLIVGDEVQFGFARPGRSFWGFAAHGLVPDIVTMGKPIGNGHPLGVVVTRREVLDRFMKVTGFFSTFGGNPVSAAAGLAVLEVIEREGLQRNALETGAYLRHGLGALVGRHRIIGDVRGTGLLLGVEIVRDRGSKEPDRAATDGVKNRMRDLGVLVGTEGVNGNILKIRPPLPFRPEHADLVVAALDQAATAVEAG